MNLNDLPQAAARAVPYGTPGARYMNCSQYPWPLSLPYRQRQEADWLASELIVDPHSDEWAEVEQHMSSRRALLALLQGDAEAARFALLDAVAYRAGERLAQREERAREESSEDNGMPAAWWAVRRAA